MASVVKDFSRRLVSDDFEKAIEKCARELFSRLRVKSMQLRAENDHDGDPVLKMDIEHLLVEAEIKLADVRQKDDQIRDLAWKLGDSRFLHIRHAYDEKQNVSLLDE